MKQRNHISDYSPLFEGMSVRPLRIEDRGQVSVLFVPGGEVEGSRRILERVRDGILRNGGPRSLWDRSRSSVSHQNI